MLGKRTPNLQKPRKTKFTIVKNEKFSKNQNFCKVSASNKKKNRKHFFKFFTNKKPYNIRNHQKTLNLLVISIRTKISKSEGKIQKILYT